MVPRIEARRLCHWLRVLEQAACGRLRCFKSSAARRMAAQSRIQIRGFWCARCAGANQGRPRTPTHAILLTGAEASRSVASLVLRFEALGCIDSRIRRAMAGGYSGGQPIRAPARPWTGHSLSTHAPSRTPSSRWAIDWALGAAGCSHPILAYLALWMTVNLRPDLQHQKVSFELPPCKWCHGPHFCFLSVLSSSRTVP